MRFYQNRWQKNMVTDTNKSLKNIGDYSIIFTRGSLGGVLVIFSGSERNAPLRLIF
jgi:hypothetical protein